jgi:nucleoside-diphosphate-sugar epimerase
VARLFGIFGFGQVDRLVPNLYESVRAGRTLRVDPAPGENGVPDGLRLSLCYVDDAVRVLARLLEQGGPPCLNVASPEIWSIRRLGQAIGRLAGRPVRFETGEHPRRGDLVADVSRLVRYAGSAFVSVEEGLARALPCDAK